MFAVVCIWFSISLNVFFTNNFLIPVLYGMVAIIFNVCLYIKIKQRLILDKAKHLVENLNQRSFKNKKIFYFKFLHLNRFYAELTTEIKDYNHVLSRYLDILFLILIIVICYITYLFIFVELNPFLTITLVNIHSGHVLSLFSVIGSCASISRSNVQMNKLTLQLYNIANRQKLFDRTQFYQVIHSKY